MIVAHPHGGIQSLPLQPNDLQYFAIIDSSSHENTVKVQQIKQGDVKRKKSGVWLFMKLKFAIIIYFKKIDSLCYIGIRIS